MLLKQKPSKVEFLCPITLSQYQQISIQFPIKIIQFSTKTSVNQLPSFTLKTMEDLKLETDLLSLISKASLHTLNDLK